MERATAEKGELILLPHPEMDHGIRPMMLLEGSDLFGGSFIMIPLTGNPIQYKFQKRFQSSFLKKPSTSTPSLYLFAKPSLIITRHKIGNTKLDDQFNQIQDEFDRHMDQIKTGFPDYCGQQRHFQNHKRQSLIPDSQRLLEYATPPRPLARP